MSSWVMQPIHVGLFASQTYLSSFSQTFAARQFIRDFAAQTGICATDLPNSKHDAKVHGPIDFP